MTKEILKELKGTPILRCDELLPSYRIYPLELVKKSIEEDECLKEKLVLHTLLGPSRYDESTKTTIVEPNDSEVSISVEKLYFDDTILKADISILDTESGRELCELINKNTVKFNAVGTGTVCPEVDSWYQIKENTKCKVTEYKFENVSVEVVENE